MKLLKKDSSKGANSDSQKDIIDISNVITDIDSITAINNYVNNSVTDRQIALSVFFGKVICFMNNKRCYLLINSYTSK